MARQWTHTECFKFYNVRPKTLAGAGRAGVMTDPQLPSHSGKIDFKSRAGFIEISKKISQVSGDPDRASLSCSKT